MGPQAPDCVSALSCTIATSFEQLESVRQEWNRFVQKVGGDIYFSFEWCRVWWRYYAYHRQLHILLLRDQGQLVGILPMMIDRLGIGPVSIRLAKLIGSDSTTLVLNPAVDPSHAREVYARLLHTMLHDLHCDAVWFGPLSGEHPHRQRIRDAMSSDGLKTILIQDKDTSVHTVFHLAPTFDEYLRTLSKKHRHEYRRVRRELVESHGLISEDVCAPEAVASCFDDFARMHQTQWTRQGKLGHFQDWPTGLEFNQELIHTFSPSNGVCFQRLWAGGEVVAYEFCLRFGDTEYWRLSARKTEGKWERLGLGRVALVDRIGAAICNGASRFEGGPGRYEYKVRFGAVEYPVGSMLIANNCGTSRIRARLLSKYSDLFHLLYYRIWFGRIAPRLPLPRRPLWKSWIRSRL